MRPNRSGRDGIQLHRPHPEEPCEARRLEGWTLARRCLWPSFETRESKSAVADFDTIEMPKSGRPDFGARSTGRGLIDDVDTIRTLETAYQSMKPVRRK